MNQRRGLPIARMSSTVACTVRGCWRTSPIRSQRSRYRRSFPFMEAGGEAGHKRDSSTIVVKQWAGFGMFAMSIDYRLVGCTPAPACYQDVQCAIRYVHAHAKQLNVDTKRIFLIGQSAGGHMVSLAATLGDGPFPRTGGWEKASNDFRAAVSVAANYELTTLSWGNIWTPAKGDPIAARKLASPVNHVSKKSKPLLILHSDNDRSVPIDNALLMIEALEKADAKFTFHRYPS